MKHTTVASRGTHRQNAWCKSIWDSFAADSDLQRLHRITEPEMRALARVSMLGEVLSKQDYIFILTQMRAKRR